MDREPPAARRLSVRAGLACALALSHSLAQGQDNPPPGFFAGEYELTGRALGPEGVPLLDWVRIFEAPDGTLILDACRLGVGTLVPDWEADEHLAPLTGAIADWELYCEMFVDRGNFPQLICYATGPEGDAEVPGLISLWWSEWQKPTHAEGC